MIVVEFCKLLIINFKGANIMKNKKLCKVKHPLLSCILWTFVLLVPLFIAGMVSSIIKISTDKTFLGAFSVVAIILIIKINSKKQWLYYGFSSPFKFDNKRTLELLPLFVLACIPIVSGINTSLKMREVLYVVVFMLIVAFVEETIFRGIMVKYLVDKGRTYAVLVSSMLFSFSHILNLLNGKGAVQLIIQLCFALVTGMVLAVVVIRFKNIVVTISYHYINNVVVSFSNSCSEKYQIIIAAVMLILAITYLVYLLNGLKNCEGNRNI